MRKGFQVAIGGLLVVSGLIGASIANAQSYDQNYNSGQIKRPRGTVATQPSNSPFSNPIMQPLPPAQSINPAQNSNRNVVPMWGSSGQR